MARNRLRGDAPAVAQVDTFEITAAGAAADEVEVVISNKSVVAVVPTSPTTATVAAAVAEACADSDHPEFREVTWTSDGADVYATATTPGTPFTISAVNVTGTVTASAVSNVTPSGGPNHWDDPLNWSAGTVPATGEDVDLQDLDVDVKWGLAQSGVTLASLNLHSTFTGRLGLIPFNGSYYEYRATELAIGATLCVVGEGDGAGSPMIRLNTGSVQTNLRVKGTGAASAQGQPAVWWRGTHASNAVVVTRGTVGLAYELGQAATLASLRVGSTGGLSDAVVWGGAGLSLTAHVQASGDVTLLNTVSTVVKNGGTLTLGGLAVAVTSIVGQNGDINFDATGTVTTTDLFDGCTLVLDRDPRAGKTFTTLRLYAGSGLTDENEVAAFTNPVQVKCKLRQLKVFEIGADIAVQRS